MELDDIMAFLFQGGKSLIWDGTCSDTFSGGNFIKSVIDLDIIAKQAEIYKLAGYWLFFDRFFFVPIVVEMSGILDKVASWLKSYFFVIY